MDVLLLHDAPQGMDLHGSTAVKLPPDEMTENQVGGCGCGLFNELIEAVEPKHVFCGHWHRYQKKTFGNVTCTMLNRTGDPPADDCMVVVEV
jgi:Icc-related predicted phosphoesterase